MPTVLGALMMTPFVYLVVNTFVGPLSPPSLTSAGWRWFFNISSQMYLTEGITTDFFHNLPIRCKTDELFTFFASANQTCGEYAATFLSNVTGYISDLSTTDQCKYCSYTIGDQYVSNQAEASSTISCLEAQLTKSACS